MVAPKNLIPVSGFNIISLAKPLALGIKNCLLHRATLYLLSVIIAFSAIVPVV